MYVYGLFDPITNELRYVGKTNDIETRLRNHLSKHSLCEKNYKNNWIKLLASQNIHPTIEIIDNVKDDEWIFWEQWYIQYFKSIGSRLTNMTDGGENPPSWKNKNHSRETKIKMSVYAKNRTEQHKYHNNLCKYGREFSEETKKKMSLAKLNGVGMAIGKSLRKLSDEQIIEIRKMINKNVSKQDIMKKYKIGRSIYFRVKHNQYKSFGYKQQE